MDTTNNIAAYSTAMSQANLQSAVSTKVLKMAQNSQQSVGDMITQMLDSLEESMKAANNIDTYA
ncbi:MAG: YjfB family protein [Phycisphaerae bacterium]|nr:YjfB family protein [Phycisphaerae bacterium]